MTVSSSADGPVVEDEDSVSLKCEVRRSIMMMIMTMMMMMIMMQVDANPEAEITWRKDGDRRVLGNFPVLDIGVVSR